MKNQGNLNKNLYIPVSNDDAYYKELNRAKIDERNVVHSKANRGMKLFYKKDSKLIEVSNGINLDSIRYKHISSTGPLQKIIIGSDDRIEVSGKVFPYKAISLLLIKDKQGNTYWGTGFFIAEKCVITAGHCVFFNNDWAKEIQVIPGANRDNNPFGAQVSTSFRSVLGWTNHNDNNYDHGAIILKDNTLFNNINAHFDFKEYTNENNIEISGYPLDKKGTQWKSIGTISRSTKSRFFYDLDTLSGNSGSPVYIENGERRIAIGVHTYGDNPNSAVSVNQEIIGLWTEWSNL